MIGIFKTPRPIDYLCTPVRMDAPGQYIGPRRFTPFMWGRRFSGIALAGLPEWPKHPLFPFSHLLVCVISPTIFCPNGRLDTIPYFTLIMSCVRANYVVFPISPRNSPTAIAHLIDKVGVNHLLIGHEPAMLELANDALDILRSQYPLTAAPDVSYVPLFEDLFLPSSERSLVLDLPYEYKGPDATACIMHSSGSSCEISVGYLSPTLFYRLYRFPQAYLLDKSSHHSRRYNPLVRWP